MNRLIIALFIFSSFASAEVIKLPEPDKNGVRSLASSIYSRKSVRIYKKDGLELKEVAQLLWSAAGMSCDGITGPTRVYPSAGGIYPLEFYLVVKNVKTLIPGLYRYLWREHALENMKKGDLGKQIFLAAWGQLSVARAPILIIITGDYKKTMRRYGKRAIRYVHMEAGHACENILLQAEALGLGAVAIGAFRDEAVKNILGVNTAPLYIIPIGKR